MDEGEEAIDQGYDERRFEGEVSENFKCPICLNVLKEPLQCQGNEHYFCNPCIKRHLDQGQQTCPVCIEPLTLQNVRKAPRIVTQCILEMKISCEYAERGCEQFVKLEDLRQHVDECGYAPVECGQCGAIICKDEKRQHDLECETSRRDKEFEEKMRRELSEVKHYLKRTKEQFQYELKRYQGETRRELDRIRQSVGELRKHLEDCRRSQEKSRVQFVQFMDEMRGEMKRLTARLPSQDLVPVIRKAAIVICGGFRDNSGKPTNSVEMYHETMRQWQLISPMNMRRAEASSVFYQHTMITSGGWTSENATSTIEMLNFTPPVWKKFPTEIPVNLFSHRCTVHGNKMFVTGGWRPDKKVCYNSIYEVLLEPPYNSTLVEGMPDSRCLHAAEVVGNQLFILGGTTTCQPENTTASVLVYTIGIYGKPVVFPALPYPVSSMASVVWRDRIILAGGKGPSGRALATVIMYHTQTGESNLLPCMKHARDGCSVVVLQDRIVVMGGKDENNHVQSSVEYYDFDRYTWEELPPMIEPRASASAVVMVVN